ncbi:MAG TPA: AraC family ligand binding domain-containing protein [Steroidobacteraceae bacterium]
MSELRIDFDAAFPTFVDQTGVSCAANSPWAPVIVTKEQIDSEVDRLAALPRPANGRRSSLIVHSAAITPALAPGIQVALSVLNPGERTTPFRHNATEVNFCIRGSGRSQWGNRSVAFGQFDVWNTPSYSTYWRENSGSDLQVCLTYSNASLLRYMQVYVAEENPGITKIAEDERNLIRGNGQSSPYGVFEIGSDGAMLMPYETVIDPPAIESKGLFWPWETVHSELKRLEALGSDYVGRRLYLLYNPMTGRTNGTTPNFFATITIRPPNIVDRPHRHVSAAINYYFRGQGRSSVAGNLYEWKAGDLMLSAPGWTVHNHASYEETVYELTIQDQPLNIAMESLLWQENMKKPPALLGVKSGVDDNFGRLLRTPS